jgi:methylmalonyl-CoA mutase N-terminal domain/subunit
MAAHLQRFKQLKSERDAVVLREKIDTLYRVAHARQNAHPAMIEALMADASIGEVWGTVRLATGLPYDPFRVLESPFGVPRV